MNPALTAFLAAFDADVLFGEVLIRRVAHRFDLRHVADRNVGDALLEQLAVSGLRALAQFTAEGVFRPLKSAPNLRRGWHVSAADEGALETALNHLYPGAIADWFAARSNPPPITSYREFTARQTGMYRITTLLDDIIAGAAIRACCHADFCLKRRLWSVSGLAADEPQQKSLAPCLEPCAILLRVRWLALSRTRKDRSCPHRWPIQQSPQAISMRPTTRAGCDLPWKNRRWGLKCLCFSLKILCELSRFSFAPPLWQP